MIWDSLFVTSGEDKEPIPLWWQKLYNSSQRISIQRPETATLQIVTVLSAPTILGALSAVSLGLLEGYIEKEEQRFTLTQINLDDVQKGQSLRVLCGKDGSQEAIGELVGMDRNGRPPYMLVGDKKIALNLIKEVYLLPDEAGKPMHFAPVSSNSAELKPHGLNPLRKITTPIMKCHLLVRAAAPILEELDFEVIDTQSDSTWTIRELLHAIKKGEGHTAVTVIANSSQDLESVLISNQHLELIGDEAPELAILVGGEALLQQLDSQSSPHLVAIIGRDDRQLESVKSLLSQTYAYAEAIPSQELLADLPDNVEILQFRRRIS